MPALSFDVISGIACIQQPDSGAYYAYLQQLNGKTVQASRRFDLGTVAPVTGQLELEAYADELLAEKVSSDQRDQVVALNIFKLCCLAEHVGLPETTDTNRLERVGTVAYLKQGGKRYDLDPPRVVPNKKSEVDSFRLRETDSLPLPNVVSAALSQEEFKILPIQSIHEAAPARLGHRVYFAIRDNEQIVEL